MADGIAPDNFLSFPGKVVLISTVEQDWLYAQELSQQSVVGVDFEWRADRANEDNPLSLAQVCTRKVCYIWLLYRFPEEHGPPPGLHALLRNEGVIKVGCALRSNDLQKLQRSGFQLPALPKKLPKSFVDVQEFKVGGKASQYKSLESHTMMFLGRKLPPLKIHITQVDWRDVETDEHLLAYAVLDAYAVLEIFYIHEDTIKLRELASLPKRFADPSELREHFGGMISLETEASRAKAEATVYTVTFEESANGVTVMYPTGDSEAEQFHFGLSLKLYSTPSCITARRYDNVVDEVILQHISQEKLFGRKFQVNFDVKDGVHYVLRQYDLTDLEEEKVYYMKVEFNPVPFNRMMAALQTWNHGLNPRLISAILSSAPLTEESNRPIHGITNIDGHMLNDSQQEALQFAISRTFSLIHGPPGTGKTHTLAAIVYSILKNTDEKILVCAPSNDAADNLAEMLIKAFRPSESELVIVKALSKQEMAYPAILEKHMAHIENEYMRTRRKAGVHPRKILSERISGARIVCSTLSASGGRLLADVTFPCVLIDEASQCNEVECLIGIAHKADRLILAGDHKQLGPVINARALKGQGFERSMFERLIDFQTDSAKLLQMQYRMHPDISRWPMEYFYEGKVKDGITAKDRVLPLSMQAIFQPSTPSNSGQPVGKASLLPVPNFPLQNILIHVRGTVERNRFRSAFNKEEADLSITLYHHFTQKMPDLKVVILSAYLGQAGYINAQMRRRKIRTRIAYTVSQFQGREADIIIMSITKSSNDTSEELPASDSANGNFSLGFLSEPQRINVALTRAKYLQILIGDVSLLKTSDNWRNAVDYYSSNKSLFARAVRTNPVPTPKGPNFPLLVQIESTTIPTYIPQLGGNLSNRQGADASAAASSSSASISTNTTVPKSSMDAQPSQPTQAAPPKEKPQPPASLPNAQHIIISFPNNVSDIYVELVSTECAKNRFPEPNYQYFEPSPGAKTKDVLCVLTIGMSRIFRASHASPLAAKRIAAYMAYGAVIVRSLNLTLDMTKPIDAVSEPIAPTKKQRRQKAGKATPITQTQPPQHSQKPGQPPPKKAPQQQRKTPQPSSSTASSSNPVVPTAPSPAPSSWMQLQTYAKQNNKKISVTYSDAPNSDEVICTVSIGPNTRSYRHRLRTTAREAAARALLPLN